MNKATYNINSPNDTIFTFISKGRNGEINKAVLFQNIEEDLFNLVLLDYDVLNETWSDENISNNGDIVKVLATVMYIITVFLASKPNVQVYIQANSETRNKLYNRLFQNYFNEFESKFEVMAYKNFEIQPYSATEKYEKFYLKLKIT